MSLLGVPYLIHSGASIYHLGLCAYKDVQSTQIPELIGKYNY